MKSDRLMLGMTILNLSMAVGIIAYGVASFLLSASDTPDECLFTEEEFGVCPADNDDTDMSETAAEESEDSSNMETRYEAAYLIRMHGRDCLHQLY